jgi:hypothetical protein
VQELEGSLIWGNHPDCWVEDPVSNAFDAVEVLMKTEEECQEKMGPLYFEAGMVCIRQRWQSRACSTWQYTESHLAGSPSEM